VLDAEAQTSIREQVSKAASFVGGEALIEEDLLAEVANLVERPTAVLGNFNPAFLHLPREVLASVMKKQQRYFPIEKDGKLMPNFVAVRNGDTQNLDLVQQGNEHVWARFADADFFVRGREAAAGRLSSAAEGPDATRLDDAGEVRAHPESGGRSRSGLRLTKATASGPALLGYARRSGHQMDGDDFAARGHLTRVRPAFGSRGGGRAIGEQYNRSRARAGLVVALRTDWTAGGLFAVGLAPTGKDPSARARRGHHAAIA
jgi:hypothetical protein